MLKRESSQRRTRIESTLTSEPPGPRRGLRVQDAARYLGVSVAKLNKERIVGDGPPYCKFGGSVIYLKDDLDRFIESRRTTSTSAEPSGAK